MTKPISLLKPNKWIRTTLLLALVTLSLQLGAQTHRKIYSVSHGDSSLTKEFVLSLCKAARKHTVATPGKPDLLEQLILEAAGAEFNTPKTPAKTLAWHTKFGQQAYCEASGQYPEGNFLRQVVYSNYRGFANIIGPKNRLTLNLKLKDPHDKLDMFEFVDKQISDIEARHDNRRFEFQQDIDWQNIMFFYFLFSEYKINYDAQLKE